MVGLMEIQNKGEYTVSKLVDALNEAIAPGTGLKTYAVVPKPASTGSDAIRVAMIYKPAALSWSAQRCPTLMPSTIVHRWRRPSWPQRRQVLGGGEPSEIQRLRQCGGRRYRQG
jgi:hypothetical protein